jgi:hypothetical protein
MDGTVEGTDKGVEFVGFWEGGVNYGWVVMCEDGGGIVGGWEAGGTPIWEVTGMARGVSTCAIGLSTGGL